MGVEEFKKIFVVIRNRGRWSDKIAAASPKAIPGKVVLEKILFLNVLELFIQDSCSLLRRR